MQTIASFASFASSEMPGDVWIAVGNRISWRTAGASNWAIHPYIRCWTNCGNGSTGASATYTLTTGFQ